MTEYQLLELLRCPYCGGTLGLADNAALLIAPRERSRHLDLGGRSFLHEYRADEDPDTEAFEDRGPVPPGREVLAGIDAQEQTDEDRT